MKEARREEKGRERERSQGGRQSKREMERERAHMGEGEREVGEKQPQLFALNDCFKK